MECRKRKAREWQIRLTEDIKEHKNGKFVTFTFSNESLISLLEDHKDLQGITGYALDNAFTTKAKQGILNIFPMLYSS